MTSLLIEIFATIFGLIQGILILQNKRSNWIFYILNISMLLVFSIINYLYGDIINNIIYLIMGVSGAILWSRRSEDNKITTCSTKERLLYMFLIFFVTILLGNALSKTNDPLPFMDAFSTTSSFMATLYMVRRKIDTWIIWTINDISYIVEYSLLPETAYCLIVLNTIWTLMAILSYINWNRIIKTYKK